MQQVIIIGSGPAAHTAGIYAGRANVSPLLFEGLMAGGVAAGGQLTTTTEVENFPGFPQAISGPELMQRMREQSINNGVSIKTETIEKITIHKQSFSVFTAKEEYQTKAIIVATGATAKRLFLPGEQDLWQRGISACAVCDGALPIFRNGILFVIGGGDTACEEALFLTKYASQVYLVHRRNELRASKVMQARVLKHTNIKILWDSEITEVLGEKKLNQVNILNKKTNTNELMQANGLFYAIGHKPNTDFLNNQVKLDETGYIITKPGTTQTNIPGIFAAGDVQDKRFRQAITSAGSGCMAFMEVEEYLENLKENH